MQYAVIENGEIVLTVFAGNPIYMPNGNIIMGWEPGEVGEGITVVAIQDPDNVPADKSVVSGPTCEMVNGVPKWVFVLADRVISPEAVTMERDRRLDGGFMFNGKCYDFDAVSKMRIAGGGSLALGAIMTGAQVGDYFWHGGSEAFSWIANDNSVNAMDAHTMFAFAKKAAEWESLHVSAARQIKDLPTIPLDYEDNAYWPVLA